MVASFEVDGDGRVRKVLKVNGQDFLRDVVVILKKDYSLFDFLYLTGLEK
jgi:hypothetical protein